MKTRNGFISNSSSSSFILAFPHKPKDVADVKKILFDTKAFITYYDDTKSTDELAERIFTDLQNGQKERFNVQEPIDVLFVGYYEAINENKEYKKLGIAEHNAYDKEFAIINRLSDKYGNEYWNHYSDEEKEKLAVLTKEYDEVRNKLFAKKLELATEIFNKFKEQNKDAHITVLEYGDRYREIVLEYGGVFDNIKHIEVSNH